MGTLFVALIVLTVVFLVVRVLIRDKKAGKSSCGGNCGACGAGCASCGGCGSRQKK